MKDNILNERFNYPEGKIKEITEDKVVISLPDGKETEIPRRTAIQSINDVSVYTEPKVKVGQKVKQGDVITGAVGLTKDTYKAGLNTLVLFHAYHGLINEDALVVSESYANRMSSYSIIDMVVHIKSSAAIKWIAPIGTKLKSKDNVMILNKATRLTEVNKALNEKLGGLFGDDKDISEYIIEDSARIPVTVDIASEFRYRNPIIENGDLCIFISQSGETADTLASLREAKKRGAFTLSIVNVLYSTIARESDGVIYTNAGAEIAVATTKAFSAQLSVVYILASFLAYEKGLVSDEYIKNFTDEIICLPQKINATLNCDNIAKALSKHIATKEHIFFIGRGIDYPLCLEGALKLKEISYIHCDGYGAGELKHGTISLIEDGTIVIAIATDHTLLSKMISNIKEVKSRGAFVIAIVKEGTKDIKNIVINQIFIVKI